MMQLGPSLLSNIQYQNWIDWRDLVIIHLKFLTTVWKLVCSWTWSSYIFFSFIHRWWKVRHNHTCFRMAVLLSSWKMKRFTKKYIRFQPHSPYQTKITDFWKEEKIDYSSAGWFFSLLLLLVVLLFDYLSNTLCLFHILVHIHSNL